MPAETGDGGSTGGGGGPPEMPQDAGPGANPAAVGEGFQWRRRALAAEQKLEEAQARFQEQLKDLETQLVAARQGLDDSERRRAVDAELLAAGALDLETARLLSEAAISGEADPAETVAELRRRKPFLFRSAPAASAMSAEAGPPAPGPDLAAAARESGDRRALLRYLRSKRGR